MIGNGCDDAVAVLLMMVLEFGEVERVEEAGKESSRCRLEWHVIRVR
jgi:hypothetical protein